MNQKGSVGVIAAIIFFVIVLIILIIPKGQTIYETPHDPLSQLLPSPSLITNTGNYHFINTVEDALKYPEEVTKLQLCRKNLNEISPKIGELVKTKHLDLSENNLTTLPDEISKLSDSLRELVLIDNNFSTAEQSRIKKLLPYTKIAFSRQKNFDPYFKENWESYDSKKYGFSFRYHPELLIKENNNGLSVENEFAGMNSNAFDSCVVDTAFIKMAINVEDNPENLTPIQYLEKLWKIHTVLKGENYLVESEQERTERMVGEIKKYKNGDLEGVIGDSGESEHPRIVTSHNGKIYTFQYLPGGQTGSRIADVARQTLEQTLATFKYTN